MNRAAVLVLLASLSCCRHGESYDVLIRHGTVYDGSGLPPTRADVAIRGDTIAAMGDLSRDDAKLTIDATGLAVTPGFINMLSQTQEALLVDGRAQSDIRQGVTLEIMGEGESMGPLNDRMKQENASLQADIKYPIAWTTLDEYLRHLEKRGVSPNVASFIGATTVRRHELGNLDRAPTPEELARMKALVAKAMDDGALGVASALIYAPGFYAKTDELIELCRPAAERGGIYISHMRSEGNALLPAVDELLRISRAAGIPAEIFHLKAAGKANWPKMDEVIAKVDAARAAGEKITADMYTYPAGATGLDASMPPWVQEGGLEQWRARLRDPKIRERVRREIDTPTDTWENLFLAAGSPENILLVGFKSEALKPYTGKTLAAVAASRGTSPEDTMMDLVVEDDSRVGTVYFLMSEDNIRKQVVLPWVSFGSDEEASAPEGVFTKWQQHPRAYGNFARIFAKYVRDEKLMSVAAAVHKLTSLPAENLRLEKRGKIALGYYADLAVFDPAKLQDHATFDAPRQYATGMVHVFVNGVRVLADGEHTGATPGRVVRGAGRKH
ncbi:MAG TPA: D-aminoacylase [Candidatus Polarisedimenticolaceae bacterium]|nr:D-aminoacylase [Candidatus Polarisedimenticolaceae bacterium]